MSGNEKPLGPLELAALEIKAAKAILDAVETIRKLGGEVPPEVAATLAAKDVGPNPLARLPLGEAIIEHLKACRKPQTAKQIRNALLGSGRVFESSDPLKAVQYALKKAIATNDDVFHVRWAQWDLKSNYRTKAALEKAMAPNADFGRGGRSASAHGKRTREGMAKARANGAQIGAALKMTDDKVALIQKLILEGATAIEACKAAKVSVQTFAVYRRKKDHPFHNLPLRRGKRKKSDLPLLDAAPMLRVVK